MVAAFPVIKLGGLLLRQASKPIATYAKERAKTHPFFRKYVCMPPAQIYNWCEVKMKMWIMNLGKPVEIPKLNEAMAIELGANLLGETIIFSIAAGLVYLEYARQVRKEAAKEELRIGEMTALTESIQGIRLDAERHETQLRELYRKIGALESKFDELSHRPFAPPPPPQSSSPSPKSGSGGPSTEPTRYTGGTILNALDYITYRIPNGYSR